MAGASLGPDYDLAKRLTALERAVMGLNTRDVLQNSPVPTPIGEYNAVFGTGLSVSGVIYLDVPILIPPGKTKVIVTAIANLYFIGAAGGSGYIDAYILADGDGLTWSSPGDVATRTSALGAIVNTASPVLGFKQEGLVGSSFLVSLQIMASVPSDFPDDYRDYASLTVSCLFYE